MPAGFASSRHPGHDQTDREQRDCDERHVDPEHRTPREVLEQEAAQRRADDDAESGDRGPRTDRGRPLARRKHRGQNRQGGRHDERAAERARAQAEVTMARVRERMGLVLS